MYSSTVNNADRLYRLHDGLTSTVVPTKVVVSDFWATVCETVRPMLSDRYLSVLSVMLVYCGQTVGWIKMQVDKGGIGLARATLC